MSLFALLIIREHIICVNYVYREVYVVYKHLKIKSFTSE
jgi:hypothetical protein